MIRLRPFSSMLSAMMFSVSFSWLGASTVSTSVLPVVETDFSLLYVCTTTSVIFKCWPIPTSFSANSLQSDTLHLPVPSFKVIDLTFTSLSPIDTVLAISFVAQFWRSPLHCSAWKLLLVILFTQQLQLPAKSVRWKSWKLTCSYYYSAGVSILVT